MSKLPLPRIVAGSVIAMIAIAAVLTFTRGESPATDTASATVPGVSDTGRPVVQGSPTKPTPSSPASADATERAAKSVDSKTKTPTKTPVKSGPTKSPTTSPPKDPDPTQPPPSPTPAPTKPAPCGLLGAILGACK